MNRLSHQYTGFRLCSRCIMGFHNSPGILLFILLLFHSLVFSFNSRLLSKPQLLFFISQKKSVSRSAWLINYENFRNCYMMLFSNYIVCFLQNFFLLLLLCITYQLGILQMTNSRPFRLFKDLLILGFPLIFSLCSSRLNKKKV